MPCNCGSKNKAKYEVVHDGQVVYSSTYRSASEAVQKKYPGSVVREKP